MFTRSVIGIALIISLLILAGCATNSLSLSERADAYENYIVEQKLERLDRITSFRFDGWADLGNEHLIVSTSFSRHYLLKLQRSCFDLYSSTGIAINQTGSTLMAKFDSITVPSVIPAKCFIKDIYKISREQKKELLAIGKETEKPMEEQSEKTAD